MGGPTPSVRGASGRFIATHSCSVCPYAPTMGHPRAASASATVDDSGAPPEVASRTRAPSRAATAARGSPPVRRATSAASYTRSKMRGSAPTSVGAKSAHTGKRSAGSSTSAVAIPAASRAPCPNIRSAACENGRNDTVRSSADSRSAVATEAAVAARQRCAIMAPLGTPVDPDV